MNSRGRWVSGLTGQRELHGLTATSPPLLADNCQKRSSRRFIKTLTATGHLTKGGHSLNILFPPCGRAPTCLCPKSAQHDEAGSPCAIWCAPCSNYLSPQDHSWFTGSTEEAEGWQSQR